MAIDCPSPLNPGEVSRIVGQTASGQRSIPAAPAEEPAVSRFTLTADLARLQGSVRQTAEVRQEVLGEISRRLTSGELLTRGAAEETVQGVLESKALDGF